MSMEAVQTRPVRSTSRTSNISATATSRCSSGCYRPHGAGPFPAMIELHGGVWTENDRTRSKTHHEAFAANGIAVAALDFRQGPAGYPNSVIDINYAIRWVKANAARFKTPPRPRRHHRHLERRPSGDAGRHAAERSALCRDPAAGRLADGRRQRALRRRCSGR